MILNTFFRVSDQPKRYFLSQKYTLQICIVLMIKIFSGRKRMIFFLDQSVNSGIRLPGVYQLFLKIKEELPFILEFPSINKS